MKIFLIGFMGCGKTTLGKKLASKMGYNFVDSDKLIEMQAGMSVREYFQVYGEDEFRKLEKSVLQTTAYPENAVIATGGGAPCFFDNMEWMNRNGVTVYLSLSPKALASRLEGASEERPLLKEYQGEALVNFIEAKLQEREEFYSKALIKVGGVDLTAENLALVLEQHQRK